MPGKLKMKYARLAVGYAKDEYWSDLPETSFGQKFNSARNHTLFWNHNQLTLQKFFNLLYSIPKIDLPRYGRVSYKKLNGWAGEVISDPLQIFVSTRSNGVASTQIWAGKSVDFKRTAVFCFRHRLSMHKMTRNPRNLGEMVPLGPGLRLCSYPCVFVGEESCACLRTNYLFSTFNLFCMVKWPWYSIY